MQHGNSTRPYVFHHERIERYNLVVLEIERRRGLPGDIEALKEQARENLCWSEYIDASMVLTGKQVRITQAGHVLGVDYTIIRISKALNSSPNVTSCFTIHYVNPGTGKENALDIAPSAKILIYESNTVPETTNV